MRLNFSYILVLCWGLGAEHFPHHWIHRWRSHTLMTHSDHLNDKIGDCQKRLIWCELWTICLYRPDIGGRGKCENGQSLKDTEHMRSGLVSLSSGFRVDEKTFKTHVICFSTALVLLQNDFLTISLQKEYSVLWLIRSYTLACRGKAVMIHSRPCNN